MDYLFSPWRYQYVTKPQVDLPCVFCHHAATPEDDEKNLVVHRARYNFIMLNLYPYTTGHVMIAPYEHVASLEAASEQALQEMMLLARSTERHLREIYKPLGGNLGMNLGESAGAGIASHIHLHVLPRWSGDTSFITVLAETRVLPEALAETWRKLSAAFRK
jgi:ATP adenylyltransferase